MSGGFSAYSDISAQTGVDEMTLVQGLMEVRPDLFDDSHFEQAFAAVDLILSDLL